MALIGTHDSATGEKGYGFINLFKFFGKTQDMSIIEQAKAGIRYFDLRVRKTERGWICAHGLWETKKTFQTILKEISENTKEEFVLVSVTYEGTLPYDIKSEGFVRFIKKTIKKYSNLTLISIAEKYKKVSWNKREWNQIWSRSGYKLIGHYPHFSWKPFPPIPSFWKMSFPEEIPSDEKTVIIVDFYKE